jgi:glutathione S-transferase
MSLRLYFHPLASFCWKALIALYENDTPFEPHIVDLGDERSRTDFLKVWPIGKFPVLRDGARNCTVAEATVIIEYLDAFYPGATRFLPSDADAAWQARMWDRTFDHYIHEPMQTIVTDRLRPQGRGDAYGVEQAATQIREAYALIEKEIGSKRWAMGSAFSLVDCAAAPALFYANIVVPFDNTHKNLPAYLDRLMARASFARVLDEAQPYFPLFPMEKKPQIAASAGVAKASTTHTRASGSGR